MSYIYLCYHPDDHATMETIRDDLRKHHLIVETQSTHTADENDALYEAIDKAVCIIVLLSPSSQQSQLIRDALHHANNEGIGVFPVLVAGDADEGVLEGIDTKPLTNLRNDYENAILRLISTLWKHILEKIMTPRNEMEAEYVENTSTSCIVVGTKNAGKTEYIRNTSDMAVHSTAHYTPTQGPHNNIIRVFGRTSVTIDHNKERELELQTEKVYIWGISSELRFDFKNRPLYEFIRMARGNRIVRRGILKIAQWLGFGPLVCVIDSTRPETFVASRAMIRRFYERNPLMPIMIVPSKQDLDEAIPLKIFKDLMGIPDTIMFDVHPLNFEHHSHHQQTMMELIYKSAKRGNTPNPLEFNRPQLQLFADNPVKPQTTKDNYFFAKILFRLAEPLGDSTHIASFLNTVVEGGKFSAQDIYTTFANDAYLLATIDNDIVGLVRYHQMDYICTAEIFILPFLEDNADAVFNPLVRRLHTLCEGVHIELMIVPNYDKFEQAFWRIDYDVRFKDNLLFIPWQNAFERLGIEKAMTFQLRKELILDPFPLKVW